MNILFIISSLIFVAFACEDSCPCGSIRDLLGSAKDLVTEGPGCAVSMTCKSAWSTSYHAYFSDSNIPMPTDADDYFIDYLAEPGEQKPDVNVMDYWGVTCENKTWYVTKFPNGVAYLAGDSGTGYIEAEKMNGKGYKVAFHVMYCEAP